MKRMYTFVTYKHVYVSIITKKEEVINLRGSRASTGEVEVRMGGADII